MIDVDKLKNEFIKNTGRWIVEHDINGRMSVTDTTKTYAAWPWWRKLIYRIFG